jgi:hypothetical protein
MPSIPTNHHPQSSQLRFFSLGLVAANKVIGSNDIEVTPSEHLPFIDGQITDTGTSVQAQGTDANGSQYNTQVASSITVKATWLKENQGNRITAPDVRRGATVKLYQYGDADKYYWTTFTDDSNLRKLETVTHAYSGTQNEEEDLTPDNSYYHEISTHQGMITLHTSNANGEFTTYDMQLNAKAGYFRFQDGIGNVLIIDSTQNLFSYANSDGSLLQVLGKAMQFTSTDSIGFQTNALTFKAQTVTGQIGESTTWNSPQTTHNGNFTENGAFSLNGDMVTAAGNGSSGGSAGTGKITIAGQASLLGSLAVTGPVTASTITASQSITAPNLQYN